MTQEPLERGKLQLAYVARVTLAEPANRVRRARILIGKVAPTPRCKPRAACRSGAER